MSTVRSSVEVGAGPVTIEDVMAVARHRAPVVLAAGAIEKIGRTRAIVEAAAGGGEPVYGLTTGLGAAVDTRLEPGELAAFQRRAVLARAVGVGEPLDVEEVRATLFVRLAGLAHGASGISPALVELIRDMLNRGVHPLARRTGSLGQADLAPLAGLFLALAGEGEAEFEGRLQSGPAALAAAGLAAPELGPKDGIALINASAFTLATGALALDEARLALDAMTVAGALSLEAFRANLSVIDPRVVALRSAPGQGRMSDRLRALMAGSDLLEPGQARRVQDPLSFRCLAPVLGVAFDRHDLGRAAIEADLAGAGDSPAVLGETGEILSSVNFDTTAIALGFEGLGQALAHCSTLATFRISKLMSAEASGLPRFLARQGGTRTGFATVQKTAAALDAEIRHLAQPLGPMTAPVADGIEDYAPMTPRVIEKTRDILDRLLRLVAIEFVVACAAIDQRQGIRLGRVTGRAYAVLREWVPAFDEDRATGEEFEAVAQNIASGAFQRGLHA